MGTTQSKCCTILNVINMYNECKNCRDRTQECHATCVKYFIFTLQNDETKRRRQEAYMRDCFTIESVMRAVYDKNNIHHADYGYCVRTKRKRGMT
jgi:hypothetical protein